MSVFVHCSYDEMRNVMDMRPHPKNPNKHPKKQIDLLAKIITQQGWRAPITVSSRSGFVVRGHGRLLAARAAGLAEVPVDVQDYDSLESELADLVADNKIAELAEMDSSILGELETFLESSGIDLEIACFLEEEPIVKGVCDPEKLQNLSTRTSKNIFALICIPIERACVFDRISQTLASETDVKVFSTTESQASV